MKSIKTSLLFLAAVCCYSCTQEYQPSSEQKQDETVIIAELEVGKDVSIIVSSTYSSDGTAVFPTDHDGEARISNPENGQLNKELRSVEIEGQTRFIERSFKFFEGQEIILETDFLEFGLSDTYATAIVPPKGTIDNKEDALRSEDGDIQNYALDISLDEIPEDNYYHIIPHIRSNNRKSFLKIDAINVGAEACFPLTHMDGMLIDYNELNDNGNLQFVVQANNLSNTNPSFIYLELKTVPKAYYDFQKSLTTQKETQQGPFDAPVPIYTNIEGGQGIFIAYQSAQDSIPVR